MDPIYLEYSTEHSMLQECEVFFALTSVDISDMCFGDTYEGTDPDTGRKVVIMPSFRTRMLRDKTGNLTHKV